MLASLAMLARNSALCVAPLLPIPSATRRGLGQRQVGTGKQARRSNKKAGLGHATKGAGARIID